MSRIQLGNNRRLNSRINNASENLLPGKSNAENAAKSLIPVNGQQPRTRKALAPNANVLANKPIVRQSLAKKSSSSQLVTKDKATENLRLTIPQVKKDTLELIPPTPQRELLGYSQSGLPDDVEDIDSNDGSNVLLATDYVSDIYSYLRSLETKQAIRSNFLSEQKVLNPKMRALLVDWLVNVHHQFKLLPETLYMGISIMDRFFQYESVSKDKFQLIGVTSFLIASKYEEIIPPELTDWVVICDQLYNKKDILKMEIVILRRLKFELGRPLPIHFLRRNSKAAHADPKIHTLAKYLMELSLIDATCSPWAPSLLAAASLYVTLNVLADGEPMDETRWSPTLTYYSGYTEKQLLPFACYLCKLVQKAPHSRLTNVYQKYSSTKQLQIAKLSQLSGKFVEEMAAKAADAMK